MDSPQNIISFCTGYAGIELGLRLAGVDVREVAYVEIEAFAAANLVAKIEESKLAPAPVWTDIKTFPAEIFRRKVHGITGGYPCPPYSNAGQRKGTDDPRHLWPYILEHIGTIRPVWCFFENVEGHISLGFDEVLKSLRGLGYAVEAGLFTAAEVGAPHKRERLFILAYANKQRLQNPTCREIKSIHSSTEPPKRSKSCRIHAKTQWPARPGQKQYDWEEPRTVKSGMGRTVDGFASRVDELRLLGNGVVPEQAASAFGTLRKTRRSI